MMVELSFGRVIDGSGRFGLSRLSPMVAALAIIVLSTGNTFVVDKKKGEVHAVYDEIRVNR